MTSSIDRAEAEVERAMERARNVAKREGITLATAEKELWSELLALGRALIALFLIRSAMRPRPTGYEHEGTRYALDTTGRSSQVGTRFGKVKFSRPIGRSLGGRSPADLPVDRELGLCAGFSLGTVTTVVQLCAMLAFANARRLFQEFHEWAPSPRTILRMVDTVGAEARSFLDASAVPDADEGELLFIQVDGRGAPMITAAEAARRRQPRRKRDGTKRHGRRARRREHPRARRKKGDKSKNAKVAFVGAIYTLRRTRNGLEGPLNKRLIATFESHEALFRWLHEHAVQRGYGRKRTFFLADGSDHIWRLQNQYFPDAVPCIDWYHVVEKLWEAGGCLHSEGSQALTDWVEEQKKRLRHGKLGELQTELGSAYAGIPKTGPGNSGRRKRLLKIIEYYAEHRHRMRYAELRREDLDIGTGVIEGAVRNLVGIRLDGPGMRWGRDRAELVLHLRCILLNGQWRAFEKHLSRRSLTLPSQPTPARTHDATPQVMKEAA